MTTAERSEKTAATAPSRDPAAEIAPLENVRLSDTDRLESFSDGVFSITITLLVIDIVRPEYEAGHLWQRLVEQWPNYVAFLASFFYVGIIWLNHRAVFSRVRFCDRSLHFANLLLLLTSGLIPFPTALMSVALQHGNASDARVAVEIYAAIGCAMCLSWLALFHILAIHPYLLEDYVEPSYFPQERHRALLGAIFYAFAAVIGWAYSPNVALIIFLVLPVFYGFTSEGLTETRIGILVRRS
jgi:TMEM175 potassium channel family protein